MNAPPTSSRLKCQKCGGLNPELARFCNRCGATIAADAPAPAPIQEPRPPPIAEPAGVRNVGAQTPPWMPIQPQPPAADAATRGRRICPGCHRFNAASAAFCVDCGVSLPANSSVPLFGGPAGFWIRVVAFTIDAVLLLIVVARLGARLGLSVGDIDHLPAPQVFAELLPGLLLSLVLFAVYGMIMIGAWGGTVGKLILGLRVVRHSDGGKVPYGLALGRSLAETLSLLPLGLGYLWVALSPSKRGWHDYLCDTRVVYAKAD